MRGMYMKVLVVPSERIATMAELTVGIGTKLSALWGNLDQQDLLLRMQELCDVNGRMFSYAYDDMSVEYLSRVEIQDTLEKKESQLEECLRQGVAILNEAPSGGAYSVFSWLSNVSDNAKANEDSVAVLAKHIDLINTLNSALDKSELAFAVVGDYVTTCVRDAEPLGTNFEFLLKLAEDACTYASAVTVDVNSAEVFTTYV